MGVAFGLAAIGMMGVPGLLALTGLGAVTVLLAPTLMGIADSIGDMMGGGSDDTDSNSDNIWEVTVQITLDTFEFKYSFDNWTGQESLDSNLSCIKQTGTFVNRILGVKGDTTLPAVCWESCVECKTSSSLESNYSNSRVSIYPNPTKGEVFVEILDANLELQEVTIVNSLGKIMYSKNVNSNQIHGIDVSYFQTGIYFVKVNSLGNQIVKKLLITE